MSKSSIEMKVISWTNNLQLRYREVFGFPILDLHCTNCDWTSAGFTDDGSAALEAFNHTCDKSMSDDEVVEIFEGTHAQLNELGIRGKESKS